MKGIILAGGKGTRLYPCTRVACKQLLPVYDKPMIYYPLSTLMLAGVRDILLISNPSDIAAFQRLFGDGRHLGVSITYAQQSEPRGIAEAFIIAESFIGPDPVMLLLGDNIFYGNNLRNILKHATTNNPGGTIFAYQVVNPQDFGVVDFDAQGRVLSIEEKPKKPKSRYAVVGLYVYDNQVVDIAKNLRPSARGELEITDVNVAYLQRKQLRVQLMGRGMAWLDTGNADALIDAAMFIKTIEDRQGLKIGCIEEVAYYMGYIDAEQLRALARPLKNPNYKRYLLNLVPTAG